jgi:hypothetical protein
MNHDSKGRFKIGNTASKGNPLGGTVAKLRASMIAAITPERITEIIESLLEAATSGDINAAKLVLLYSIGKPLDPPDIADRIRALEEQLNGQDHPEN